MADKGQLTLFVIIGIILLLAIGIFLYAQRERITVPVEAERIRLAEVPTTVQPIRDFVQTCLSTVAREGLQIIGEHGGYLDTRTLRFNPAEPTERASAVQFAPDSEIKVPYWWHMNARNDCVGDCTFTSEQPPLTRAEGGGRSVEAQLDRHVVENLPKCLGTFEQFRAQQFIITPVGEIKPETRITQGNVIVLLNYPLEIRRAQETFALKEYVAELPVNLYKIYMLAANITQLQAQYFFLERATRNLIDIFGRASEDALPPVTEMEFGFGRGVMWTKFDVEQKLMQMLTSYIPLLKTMNTRNYQYFLAPPGTDRELYEVMYNRGFTVPLLEPHRSLNVRFSYLPWWNPYFHLNCNGQICQAEGFSSTFAFLFGVRRYAFAYDISYPVLVEITNPDAYGGEGYAFRFFLEANMRNNEPLATLEEPIILPAAIEDTSLLCDEAQRTGGNITLIVRTSAGEPVHNAEILYRCGTETCSMGTSIRGRLVAPFPRCVGGFVTAQYPDLTPAVQPLDILDANPQTVDLTMGVPYSVDFTVKKWVLRKTTGWDLDANQAVNQGPRENTIIMLERKGEEFEEPIMVFAEVCGSPFNKASIPCGTPPGDTSKDVRIYPGDYHVTIHSFHYPSPDLKIPPEKRCVKYKIGHRKRTKCFRVPPQDIVFNTEKPLISGYAEFDWSVSDEQLRSAKAIEFSYINFGLEKVQPPSERKIEDLEIMGRLFTYSEQYLDLLKPKIT